MERIDALKNYIVKTNLDSKYAGFYDPPLMSDYAKIAKTYVQRGIINEN